MSSNRSKDRLSLCSFTFADGRRCRMPRQSGHPYLCCFHARKEAQAQAAEEVGRDIRFLLSGDYLSAGDLSLALGRVFAAAARGQLKPKTAGTLAYLGQTLLQTIQLAQHEYINAFSTDSWRRVIYSHLKENSHYLVPPPAPTTAPPVAPAAPQVPAQTAQQLPPQAPSQNPDPNAAQTQTQDLAPNPERGSPATEPVPPLQPTDPDPASPSMTVSPSAQTPPPCSAGFTPASSLNAAPARLPRSAAEFAATILASARPSALSPARAQTIAVKPVVPAAEAASPTGPSGLPVLAAVPPRTATPQPARPPDSSPSQTSKPAAAPPTRARH